MLSNNSTLNRQPRQSRVLWVGDAVVSSGFSRCTHAVCDHLHSQNWDVHILGLNYFGDQHSYPYSIYPCYQPLDGGRDYFGVSRLPLLIERLNPDIVVLLNDPWNVPAYLDSIEGFRKERKRQGVELSPLPKIVAWLAVDGKNQKGNQLNRLDAIATWTQFASDELTKGGCDRPSSVIPLGVDRSTFHPLDKSESRRLCCPDFVTHDSFVIGVVGRNQPRKRLDLAIQYFAEWVHSRQIDNAHLFLHIAPTGDKGCDIRSLCAYYGLMGNQKVILSEPSIGYGESDINLNVIYNSLDVLLSTSQGEGWGLPILEAMACGVLTIAPDWSGVGDWAKGISLLCHCSTVAPSAPLNSLTYTIGGIPDGKDVLRYLDLIYQNNLGYANLDQVRQNGFDLADRLSWDQTGKLFQEFLGSVLSQSLEDTQVIDSVDCLEESVCVA